MASPYRLGVALTELAHAEREALRARDKLSKLVAVGAATDADKAAFLVIATKLYTLETTIYGQIVDAIRPIPGTDDVIARIPTPTQLTVPDANEAKVAIPVWALVVIIVIVSIVVIAAVVFVIEVSVDVVANIILTYKQADAYADGLQRRMDCLNSCLGHGQTIQDCTTSCNQTIQLPPPPTPPSPPPPANPNLPWWIGGALAGTLGALGIAAYYLKSKNT